MAGRKAISKKLRFEVFKRDGFKCQYCGKSAPDVVLHVDHINPVAKGGSADILNLITSCQDCNLGKGARTLSDDTTLQKQKAQLAELNEKREQLEMMLKWRQGLNSMEDMQVKAFDDRFGVLTSYRLSDVGRNDVKKWLRKFTLAELLDGLDICATQYLVAGKKDKYTSESVDKVIAYVPRVCANKKKEKENPALKDLYYARAILRNRLSYINDRVCLHLLEEAQSAGVDTQELIYLTKISTTWSQFKGDIEELIGG